MMMKNEVVLDSIDEDIYKHINEMWKCVRLNNSTIPDDLLDEFKMVLLTHYDGVGKYNRFWETFKWDYGI